MPLEEKSPTEIAAAGRAHDAAPLSHWAKYAEAYIKGACLVLGELAVQYVTAVKGVTHEQWLAMDTLHRSAFWVEFIGGAAFTLVAFMSTSVATAKTIAPKPGLRPTATQPATS